MTAPNPAPAPPKKNFLRRRIETAVTTGRTIAADPRATPGLLRGWVLGLWRARGGGFYGLGYVICFFVLEIRTITQNFLEAEDAGAFLLGAALEFLFRFALESIVNGVLALIWPLLLWGQIEYWSLAILIPGYFVFTRWVQPRFAVPPA